MKISPHAVVDPHAQLAEDVEVGPFCVIGPDVTIGPGTRLLNNVTVVGRTTIGRDNIIYPNAVLGTPPQDRKDRGDTTRLEIGDNNIIREAVTIHTGTERGGAVTRIGTKNLLMVNVHIGHDAQVGSNCVFVNNVMIAGHVVCGDNVNMMGGVGVHHFVSIGEYAFLGGYARVHHDVPPYCKIDGPDLVRGLNIIGLRRAGFTDDDIDALEEAVRELFYRDRPLSVAMAEFNTSNGLNPYVKTMLEFLKRRDSGRHGRYLEGLRAR
jgi:UDP-N-acetylglucosamine acyltransferase